MPVTRASGSYGFGDTPSKPSGSFSGPGVVVLTGAYFYQTGVASSTGFSSIASANDGQTPGSLTTTFALYKVATDLSSEPSSYPISVSAGGDMFSQCHYLQGADLVSPIFGTPTVTTNLGTGIVTLPDIANTIAGSCGMIVCGSWDFNQWSNAQTPPSGYVHTGVPGGGEFAVYAYDDLPTGNIGGSFGNNASRFAVIQIIFAASGGTLPQTANSQFFAAASG